MKQRLISLILCFAMVLSMCTFLSFSAFAEETESVSEVPTDAPVWNGTEDVSTSLSGEGTEAAPYLIASAADLAFMAQQVNAGVAEYVSAYYKLTADIVLNDVANYENFATEAPANAWTPIGSAEATPFSGTFDGNGKTVFGLYVYTTTSTSYSGLFGCLNGATVKNLTLSKGYINAKMYIGALVGKAVNSTITGIANQSVKIQSSTTEQGNTYYLGGIVGKADTTKISDCHNAADISFKRTKNGFVSIGGIVGTCTGTSIDSRYELSLCTNNGDITSASAHDRYKTANTGGIVGEAKWYEVEGCVAKGTILNQATGSKRAGGIAGQNTGSLIISCVSYSHIDTAAYFDDSLNATIGASSTLYNGGIVGYADHNTDPIKGSMENCVFLGTQNTFFDDATFKTQVGLLVGGNRGGGRGSAKYCYGMFIPCEGNTTVIPLYGTSITNYGKTQNYEITAAHLDETATDAINASGKYANTTSIVLAMNRYAKARGESSVTFQKGENGPMIFGRYYESYDITIADAQNGAATLQTPKSLIFPEGYDELRSYYKAGEIITISAVAAEGYAPLRVEYSYDGETCVAVPGEEGMFTFEMPASAVEVQAYFVEAASASDFTVTYLDKNGELIKAEEVEFGSVSVAPEAPYVYAFEFIGWADETGAIVDPQTISTDTTLQATYKELFYTVTFVAKGEVVATETVRYGSNATAPADPVVNNFNFVRWDISFENVTSDLTVQGIFEYSGPRFGGGSGTEGDPYLLKTKEHLEELRDKIASEDIKELFVSACYKLVADVDLSGSAWSPISEFYGTFNGNGHVISNMNVGKSAFFAHAGGTIENLTFLNPVSQNAVFVGTVPDGLPLVMNNCHTINGEVKAPNQTQSSLMVGTASENLTITNSSVSGLATAHAYAGVGGFLGCIAKNVVVSVTFENCVSAAVLGSTSSGAEVSAGGFSGFSNSNDQSFKLINCIFVGSIDVQANHGAATFIGRKRGTGSVTLEKCTNYGTVKNTAGPAGGLVGFMADGYYNTLISNDCAVYGSVYSETQAGGFVGAYYNNQTTTKITNAIMMATVTCGEGGSAGAITAYLHGDGKDQRIILYTNATIPLVPEGSNLATNMTIQAVELDPATGLPVGFSSEIWAIGAMADKVAGISITLESSLQINVYAKAGIVLKAHAGKLFVNGQFITAGEAETVIKNGVEYVQFVFDGFKVADMDKALALSLVGANATQKEYTVTDYIISTYADYADDANLAAILEAIVYYGDAAQKAAYGESTVIATVSAQTGKTFSDTYVEDNFEYANLKVHGGLNGNAIALDLYASIAVRLQYAEGATKVVVTYATNSTTYEGEALGADFVWFSGLHATSLNNLITVESYVGDECVESYDTSVAMYISTALEAGSLTDNQANLAKALAVYMRAARTYHEVLYPEVSE